ncbi:hypothetical protein GV055_10505 [Marinomonas mediterranea]|nr:hypothetical protein GV055_10505 [Marinomonas mediterranea]
MIFVGGLPNDSYGESVLDAIKGHENIVITGWVDDITYHNYLSAADVAVQLRSEFRGETSAAVLDCMNDGLATIVNACGSMAEISDNDVVVLYHKLFNSDLCFALERLWSSEDERQPIGVHAAQTIRSKHSPQYCVKRYAEVIEHDRNLSLHDAQFLMKEIARLGPQHWESMNVSISLSGCREIFLCEPQSDSYLLM